MKKFVVLTLLALAACETPQDSAREGEAKKQDAAECAARGFKPDNPKYETCMSVLAQNRAQDKEEALGRARAGTDVVGGGRPVITGGAKN